ncbi:hypothetical protein BUZ08_00225 [Staphylococcus gallinarum]|uniref:hypothetical protein n=1 Tax=Staphylococcus gallinarum TaxID=1293 RepID=UPI000D1F1D20|nr:hypothetical protein [Staphylococcus gallinarum]PTL18616.1 hypothetical protein BUZ08_00225 [Staphylococcus gallinarum]RIO78860.1 hypothetical protein BUZ07_09125 [Staphylococcus gallinarum]
MAYEYEGYIKNTIRTEAVFSHEIEQKYDRMLELEEVYRKAKAYDLLKEDLLINEKVFREQAENDEVSDIIHGHYVALLVQAELERADDEN